MGIDKFCKEEKEISKEMSVFPTGEKNDAYAQYFIGQSYLNMLSICCRANRWRSAM